MQTITARNVHQALPKVMHLIKTQGVRNGPVLKVPGPVSICYERPRERVMFWSECDCNPFSHLLEALWTLAGKNNASLVWRLATVSDDDLTDNPHFSHNQFKKIVHALTADKNDQHQGLSMWDGMQIDFYRTDTGALDMTVTSRSNDALGADAVHFSMLQEYLAVMIGCEVGKYWQITNNLHLYLDFHQELMETMATLACRAAPCPYETGRIETTPLISSGDVDIFDRDVAMVLDEGGALGIRDWFCRKVAIPMMLAIQTYKRSEAAKAVRITTAQNIIMAQMSPLSDWRRAGFEWLERRRK